VLISKNEAVAGRVVGHVRGLEAEVDVLKHLDHPNIVRYLARPRRAARPARSAARHCPSQALGRRACHSGHSCGSTTGVWQHYGSA